MDRVFLGLGSNQGDSAAILESALAELSGLLAPGRTSSLWLSEPRYVEDQAPFFNLVFEGHTELEPLDLLDLTGEIEARHGRDRRKERPKGPRTLDIDILLYGTRLVSGERLELPHPGMGERKFVLLPLLELDSELRDPRTGRRFSEMAAGLSAQGIYLIRRPSYDLFHL